jgi:DNA-directed RNA polymerase specialized sigma24 family protein
MKPDAARADLNRFVTTQWSLVLSCGQNGMGEDQRRHVLGELCRTYWRPIYAFVCRRGYSEADAQDLTQDFFMRVIEGNLLPLADPNRGRFRTLLLCALQNFLADKRDQSKSKRRGGHFNFIQWEDWIAESPSYLSMNSHDLDASSAERIYDVRWAATVAEQALRRLAVECESRGKRRVFDILSRYLTADRGEISYAKLSSMLSVPEVTVKRLLHQLRVRYRAFLREEVSQTVENDAELDEEIRYLCAALASQTATE